MVTSHGSTEYQRVQNPALGAVLLWQFMTGYSLASGINKPVPLPLLFIVLPILYNKTTGDVLYSTQRASGLHLFCEKCGPSLSTLHTRALQMRPLSLESLQLAVQTELVVIDYQTACSWPVEANLTDSHVPGRTKHMVSGAHKLGDWCSKLSLFEISSLLKVAF